MTHPKRHPDMRGALPDHSSMTHTLDSETKRLAQVLADRYGTHSGIFEGSNRQIFLEPIKPTRRYIWRTKPNGAAFAKDETASALKRSRLCVCGAMKKPSAAACRDCWYVLSEPTKAVLGPNPRRSMPSAVARAREEITEKLAPFMASLEAGEESQPQEMELDYERYMRIRFWANHGGKVSDDDWSFFLEIRQTICKGRGVHKGRQIDRDKMEKHMRNAPSILNGGFSNQR